MSDGELEVCTSILVGMRNRAGHVNDSRDNKSVEEMYGEKFLVIYKAHAQYVSEHTAHLLQ